MSHTHKREEKRIIYWIKKSNKTLPVH